MRNDRSRASKDRAFLSKESACTNSSSAWRDAAVMVRTNSKTLSTRADEAGSGGSASAPETNDWASPSALTASSNAALSSSAERTCTSVQGSHDSMSSKAPFNAFHLPTADCSCMSNESYNCCWALIMASRRTMPFRNTRRRLADAFSARTRRPALHRRYSWACSTTRVQSRYHHGETGTTYLGFLLLHTKSNRLLRVGKLPRR